MTQSLPTILVVDDDHRLCDLLARYLTENGYSVKTAYSSDAAKSELSPSIQLIILDVMMPGGSGLDFLKNLRGGHFRCPRSLPVLMLTALSDGPDRILGLEIGADDYLSKPFEPKELILRLQNILKKSDSPTTGGNDALKTCLSLGDLTFDLAQDALINGWGDVVYMTSLELSLLRLFATRPHQTISRDELAEKSGVFLSPRTVDVQITRLRKRIEPDPRRPVFLQTVRHKGYILKPSLTKQKDAS